jgi:hypothetical protein
LIILARQEVSVNSYGKIGSSAYNYTIHEILLTLFINHYDAFMTKHGSTILPGQKKRSMPFFVAKPRNPGSFMSSALTAITQNGDLYLAV